MSALIKDFLRVQPASHGKKLAHLLLEHEPTVIVGQMRGHPLFDDWLDFALESLSAHLEQARGYLYVVTNPMSEGFCKVGKTRLPPGQRLKALNNEAVLCRFVLVQAWEVADRHLLEAQAHKRLSCFPRHKEFFHAPWAEVCGVLDGLCENYAGRMERFIGLRALG